MTFRVGTIRVIIIHCQGRMRKGINVLKILFIVYIKKMALICMKAKIRLVSSNRRWESMRKSDDFYGIDKEDYYGRILSGNYAEELKSWLAERIAIYHSFENTWNPAMPYISAWKEMGGEIWYEFVSHGLIDLLGCKGSEAARVFRKSIMDQRIYKYLDKDEGIEKEIVDRRQLDRKRKHLREDVKEKGVIDAVYKLSIEPEKIIWLKDQAYVQSHIQEDIYLSFGVLTVVTKEMRAEEERVLREKLQALLETAGAICHELNQPIQAVSGYSEVLLMKLESSDPSYDKIEKISKMTKKMGGITKKLMRTTRYETKEYLKGFKIVDIDRSSDDED